MEAPGPCSGLKQTPELVTLFRARKVVLFWLESPSEGPPFQVRGSKLQEMTLLCEQDPHFRQEC